MDAVIYCRLSAERSSDFSLQQQEDRCRAWATLHGHTVLRVYADDGETGTKTTRTAFTQLRRDLRILRARMLIVADLDRFMRNLREQLNLKHELDQLGVALVSLADSGMIDTRTPEGMLNFQVKGMVSEFYASTTGRKISQTLEHKARQGQWVGPLPYGYVRDGKTLAADPVAAPVVARIFHIYATNQSSYTRIAEQLNQEGIRFVHWRDGARAFSRESIRSIVSNPAYQGIVTCKDLQYPGQHPPLVAPEVWAACQSIRKQREDAAGTPASSQGVGGLLSDIARCAICGGSMWYHIGGKATCRIPYYRCATRAGRGSSACAAELVRAADADQHAMEVLRALTVPAELHDQILVRAQQLLPQPMADAPHDRAKVERQLERLRRAYLDGDETLTDTIYQAERKRLLALMSDQPRPTRYGLDMQRAALTLRTIGSVLDAGNEIERRALVQSVYTRVWLTKTETVRAITPSPRYALLVEAIAASDVCLGCPMGFEPTTP